MVGHEVRLTGPPVRPTLFLAKILFQPRLSQAVQRPQEADRRHLGRGRRGPGPGLVQLGNQAIEGR